MASITVDQLVQEFISSNIGTNATGNLLLSDVITAWGNWTSTNYSTYSLNFDLIIFLKMDQALYGLSVMQDTGGQGSPIYCWAGYQLQTQASS